MRQGMADLLDIMPSTACEVIKINGNRLTVRGLSGPAIAAIVARFPDLAAVIGGGIAGARLIAQFGHAIGPIIAAGCGHFGDERYEQRASELSVETQLDLINAIIRLTFEKGPLSFVEKLSALLVGVDEGVKPLKLRLRKSRSPSQSSSGAASRLIM
jgi:hypothetical protein